MNIGKVSVKGRVFLAPMAGITDLPFRSLCKQMGAAVVYSEMVSAKGLYYGGKNTKALLITEDKEKPFAVQIFGREPLLMAEMAKRLEQDGADLIDINMGCPAPKIVKNGEGSALMKTPLLVGGIVEAVSKAVKIPVTIKIRKGYDNENPNAVECAKIAEESGACAIAVHGRTRSQQYSGSADLSIIKAVKEAVTIPVIGNGDIADGPSAKACFDYTGCDFIMVGRASCGNPWIFNEINGFLLGAEVKRPSLEEKKRVITTHIEGLCRVKGEKVAVLEMRRHFSHYFKGCNGVAAIRSRINSVQSLDDLYLVLDSIGETE